MFFCLLFSQEKQAARRPPWETKNITLSEYLPIPIQHLPADLSILAKAKPVYETFKGWKKDISGVRSYGDLPLEAQAYLNRLSEVVGVEIGIVSVGPNRDQTFSLKEFF